MRGSGRGRCTGRGRVRCSERVRGRGRCTGRGRGRVGEVEGEDMVNEGEGERE